MKKEGALSLYNGLTAGLHRSFIFGGVRVALYFPIRDFLMGDSKTPALYVKILAAMATGAIGISIANPTDVVKVRLQNQRKAGLASEGKSSKTQNQMYKGTIDCYKKIIAQEGVPALWTSVTANISRNSVINAVEISTYDQYKQTLLENRWLEEGTPLHLVCAAGAGLNACIFGSPIDVLTTRHMTQPGRFKGPVDVITTTLR